MDKYVVIKTIKESSDKKNGVYIVKKLQKKYIYKKDGLYSGVGTEILAYKYLNKIKFPYAPLLKTTVIANDSVGIIIEYIKGITLKQFLEATYDIVILCNILKQIFDAIDTLEKLKITLYDFWEENIILEKSSIGYRVWIIDYSWVHQYKKHSKVHNNFILYNIDSEKPNDIYLKKIFGITPTFQIGKALNGLLGNMLSYKLNPIIRNWILKYVRKGKNKQTNKFFIDTENRLTSGKNLLRSFKYNNYFCKDDKSSK